MFSLNEQRAIELGEAGEKAVRENNEYDAIQNIEYLREFGEELLKGEFENDLKRVVISVRNIGNKAIQKRLEETTLTALKVIRPLAEGALEKNYSNALWSFSRAVQELGKGAAQFQMKEAAADAVDSLKIIGMGAVEKGMEVVTLWTTLSLEEVAYLSERQNLEDLVRDAKAAREEIIKASEDKKFITREQIEVYPSLIAKTVSEFAELQNLQPAGYEGRPNEEFTEEEFFEGEAGEEEAGNEPEDAGESEASEKAE